MTIPQAFELALQHHRAGRLAEAEVSYRQILAVEPRHAAALHLLGVIALQVGRHELAVDLIRQAIALAPGVPGSHSNLGEACRATGQLDEAIAACCQAIALKPDYPEAHNNFGNVLKDKGQVDEAIAAYRYAIALKPDFPEAHNNLGNVLKDKGQLDEAIAAYRQAIALKPDYPEAYSNLGTALTDKGQLDEAIAAYRQAIALKPDYPEAYSNLGTALTDKGQLDEAIAAYRQAIALKPNYPEAYSNLGTALTDKGQLGEAIAACRQAIALKPNYPKAHYHLGNALKDKGQVDEGIASYRQAIALEPNYPEAHSNLGTALKDKGQVDEAIAAYRQAITLHAELPELHFNLALGLLLQGDFAGGWEEYEWRWRWKGFPSPQRNFGQPQWDGSALEGRTLLLHAEQGFGDSIQFIRYLPLVAQGGGSIVIECQPELRRLFQRMAPGFPVVAKGQALPAFDVHCPLLGLPRVFVTDLGNIPRTVPYLHADGTGAARWSERLADPSSPLKVGLVWAGSPAHQKDRHRSLELASLAPLAEVSGVQFISMQKGATAAGDRTLLAARRWLDVAEDLKDFDDTAALITNVDLVVSVDTAVVHLAGAMGRPVWTLLPFVPDWRWLLDRSDSPWYPTIRLFRQPRIMDWTPVIAEVCEQLQLLVQSRSG